MNTFRVALRSFEENLWRILAPINNPALAVSALSNGQLSVTANIWDLLKDPFMLMGAPRSKRTAYVARQRRRAPSKLIPLRPDLEPCTICGNTKIKFYLCTQCFRRIIKKTREMQKKMKEVYENPLKPITHEVSLLYEDIKDNDNVKSDARSQNRQNERGAKNKSETTKFCPKHNKAEDVSDNTFKETLTDEVPSGKRKKKSSWFF